MHVAVVGGGLAGLSACLALKDAGHRVELFERSRLLGGKATSFEVGGVEVDNGQHVYLACCTEFVDFVEQATGFSSFVVRDSSVVGKFKRRTDNEQRTSLRSGNNGLPSGQATTSPLTLQPRFEALLLARGKAPARLRAARLPAPWHLAPGILCYGHLSPADRLRIGRAILAASRPSRQGEVFAAWLARHGQGRASRRAFWDPFLVPALNAPLEEVSAEAALFVIRTAFLRDAGAARFGYSRVPLARIAEAAAAQLDKVHLRTSVTALESQLSEDGRTPEGRAGSQEGGKRLASCVVHLATGARVAFDAIVIAVPPDRLKHILGDPATFGIRGLDEFRTAPIVDVHLWYDVSTVGFSFAALLDSPIQWVFEKGAGYLCCSMSAADVYVGLSKEELVELCHHELVELVPALAGARLLRGSATRDRDATFIPAPGLQRPGPVTRDPRVVIAGSWTDTGWPATMESAVRSGRAAARALMVQGS